MKHWFAPFLLGAVIAVCAAAPVPPQITPLDARVWACDFQSQTLGIKMRFLVMLPAGVDRSSPPQSVIYILHGRGRHERTLLENSLTRERLLTSPAAIILPRGKEGWYINSPVIPADRFADYVDEVMSIAEKHFPLSGESSHRAIMGWSMGGYGALYTASRRPGDFAAAASLIGILDFPRPAISEPGQNYAVPPRFGKDLSFWEQVNPRRRLRYLVPLPLFVAYADKAPERQMNEAFIADARALGMSLEVLRLSGGHTFTMVEESFAQSLDFLERKIRIEKP